MVLGAAGRAVAARRSPCDVFCDDREMGPKTAQREEEMKRLAQRQRMSALEPTTKTTESGAINTEMMAMGRRRGRMGAWSETTLCCVLKMARTTGRRGVASTWDECAHTGGKWN